MSRSKQYIGAGRTYSKRKILYKNSKDASQSRLGMAFEKRIETTNQLYLCTGSAVIQKIPTPAKNINGKIVYPKKSTVDFIGCAKGVPIAFEAKETTGSGGKPETNFPLMKSQRGEMIPFHQREFLRQWQQNGGKAFVLIHFKNRDECFAVPIDFIEEYYIQMARGGRKSIPYGDFKEEWKVDPDDYLNLLNK